MKEQVERCLAQLLKRYPALSGNREDIVRAFTCIAESYRRGGKLLIAGNGGSAADSEHIAGELMKGFLLPRNISDNYTKRLISVDSERGAILAEHLQSALPALALDGHPALSTAYLNDCAPLLVFAQQVNGYGFPGDALLCISTSGNSENILFAAVTAKAIGMKTLGLTGAEGGKLAKYCDVCIRVPETEVFRVQELHLPVYHCLCMMLEEEFFGGK